MAEIKVLQDLDMWSNALPKGWQIVAYGIDGSVGNKYVRIAFPNGLMASIIQGKYTYGGPEGLWEIAPCWYHGNGGFTLMDSNEMKSTVDWIDVHGWLDSDGVMEALWELAETDSERVRILRNAFFEIRMIGRR